MNVSTQPTQTASITKSKIDWPVIAFFVIAYGIAWGLLVVFNRVAEASGIKDGLTLMALAESWDMAAISDQLTVPGWFLYGLTRVQDFSFTIAGLIVTAVIAGRVGLNVLGKKFNPRLARWRWYGAAILLPYGLFGVAALLTIATHPAIFETANLSWETLWGVLFSAGAGLFFTMLLRGGLGEEPGLRGFALPRLQLRYGPTIASFIIGILWAGWHLPIYLQSDAISVVVSLLLAFSFSFLFTFFYNYARESLWVVIILHAGMNAGDNAFELVFPGLAPFDWQIPAYLGMLIVSIIAGVMTWRRSRKEPFVVTAVSRPSNLTQIG